MKLNSIELNSVHEPSDRLAADGPLVRSPEDEPIVRSAEDELSAILPDEEAFFRSGEDEVVAEDRPSATLAERIKENL